MRLDFRCSVLSRLPDLITLPLQRKAKGTGVFLLLIMAARTLGDKMAVCKAMHRRRRIGRLQEAS